MADARPTENSGDLPQADAPRSPSQQLHYFLSLPERAVRSGASMVGGFAREGAELLVPRSFQTSRMYTLMVRQMLDFVVHDIGGVKSKGESPDSAPVDNYIARKAVGNFVEMASMSTLHLSPLLVLAAVSDIAHGSQVFLNELTRELKDEGIITEETRVDHVGDLLSAVSKASAATSAVFDTPPISVEALRATIDDARQAVGSSLPVPSEAEVARLWQQMQEIAKRENVNMLAVSTAATLRSLPNFGTLQRGTMSSVKVAGSLFEQHVLDHYSQAISEIGSKGLYQSLSETGEPYMEAVWANFQPAKTTITEELISGRLIGKTWVTVGRWLGRDPEAPAENPLIAEAADKLAKGH